MFPADGDGIVNDLRIHEGGDAEMDEDDVVILAVGFQIVQTVEDGVLIGGASHTDPAHLGDTVLAYHGPDHVHVGLDADQFDGVDLGSA